MPLQQTSGNVTADAYGGGVAAVPNYIEDVFSTYLYTGNSSTQTITNGIDLAGKGGLIWTKTRNAASANNIVDTVRGATKLLVTNTTAAQQTVTSSILDSFNANGYTLSSDADLYGMNIGGSTYASWTFRKQPKFFDVVTYTGNGNTTSGQTINHNLGSVPGCIIIKRTDSTGAWLVHHRSVASAAGAGPGAIYLNTTAAASTTNSAIGYATDTIFNVGVNTAIVAANTNGATYVAYLFAHNAGGFGLTGTDNVISCGSYTGTGAAGLNVTLGYEPQLVLIKNASVGGAGYDWYMIDTMRGWPNSTAISYKRLLANSSNAEDDGGAIIAPTATGFTFLDWTAGLNQSGNTYIYIAIRRGPMKTPTSGTSVFAPVAYTGTGANNTVSSGIVTDMVIEGNRASTSAGTKFGTWDRLRGTGYLLTTTTAAEVAAGTAIIQANPWDTMTGLKVGTTSTLTNASSNTFAYWMFQRAPGFFDVVCYTGTGSDQTLTHNLGVTPELAIFKRRSSTTQNWNVLSSQIASDKRLILNTTGALDNAGTTVWSATATTIVANNSALGLSGSGSTYVAYLFASCPGVSKVGSYTGNGSTQTINCGFTGGARFVLIKRTDSTGDWYVYDTARGMTTLTDPYLLLNSTAAESATLGSVTTVTTGFAVNASILAAINTNGASYIFLAIA